MSPTAKQNLKHLQNKWGEKKAELTHGLLRRMDTGHYLACFGLVPYSFLGLFLCLNYVVHRLGHVLLYVVYYVSLKNKQRKTATTNRGFNFTSRRVGTQTVTVFVRFQLDVQFLDVVREHC